MAVTKITADFIDTDAVETTQIKDANVTTAKVADNAITLAKMASGTDGEIITYDASGDPTTLAVGTVQGTNTATLFHSGEFLQTGGAGAEPAWKVPLISKYYESANTAFTVDSTISFTHNLGAVPKIVRGVAQCIVSEEGYAVGDEATLGSVGLTTDYGTTVIANATVIKLVTGQVLSLHNPTTFNFFNPTLTGTPAWQLVAKAWL